jgi:hypothetical protein
MKGRTGRAKGGKMDMANVPNDPTGKFESNKGPSEVYAGEDSNVVKAARKRKAGGKCGDMKMKKGGMAVDGKKAAMRMDRPKRASGGKISQNWEAAQKTSERPGADIQSKNGMD